jgi:hypothetical protein
MLIQWSYVGYLCGGPPPSLVSLAGSYLDLLASDRAGYTPHPLVSILTRERFTLRGCTYGT